MKILSAKYLTSFALSCVAISFAGQNALAKPVPATAAEYMKWNTSDLNASLMADSEEPNMIWVLPPSDGQIVLYSFQPTAAIVKKNNMTETMCDGIAYAGQTAALIAKQKGTVVAQSANIAAKIQEVRNTQIELKKRKAFCSNVKDEDNESDTIAAITEVELEIEALEKKLEALQQEYEKCEADSGAQNVVCRYKERKLEKQLEKLFLKYDLHSDLEAQQDCSSIGGVLDRQIEEAKNTIAGLKAAQTELEEIFKNLQEDNDALFASYASLKGGDAVLQMLSDWNAIVEKIKEDNPTFVVAKMPVSEVMMRTGISGQSKEGVSTSVLAKIPSVRSLRVGGELVTAENNTIKLGTFPNSVFAVAELTAVSGCVLQNPTDYVGVGKPSDGEKASKGEAMISMTAEYKYERAFRTEATAKYSIRDIYSIVRESNSSTLGRCTIIDIDTLEEFNGKSFVEVDFKTDHSDLPAEEKQRIIQEIKRDVVQRVLTEFAEREILEASIDGKTQVEEIDINNQFSGANTSEDCSQDIFCNRYAYVLRDPNLLPPNSAIREVIRGTRGATVVSKYSEQEMQEFMGTVSYNQDGS